MNQADPKTDGASAGSAYPGSPAACIRVSLKSVGHRFGSRLALADVSFDIGSGQVGIVTGANGSGKSTLLRIIAGLLTPQFGKANVEMAGVTYDETERRRLIGYVAPDLTLYRELTGTENLAFFAELKGVKPTREMLGEALTEVGLRGRGRDLVSNYSSGMRQRLKYAFALLGRPPILLLDEPTANLDVDGVAMVERVVAQQIGRTGGGLAIIATNEPREAAWGESLTRLEPPV